MELIDTHCHLDVEAFEADRDAVLTRARAAGVKQLVVPAVDAAHWPALGALCGSDPGLHAALGLHPVFLERHDGADVAALPAAIERLHAVAVGEIGLDFHLPEADRQAQLALFESQLAIAVEAGLPVILHVRKAHDLVLKTLARYPVCGGIVHAFNGSLQQADAYLAAGFRLGFGGMLTYARSRKLRALAAALPAQALVLETDAPDMSVASHHGERNSPEYLPECLLALAEVRQASPASLAAQTTANARAVLRLDSSA